MEISKTGALNAFSANTAVNKNTNNFANDAFAQAIMASKAKANQTKNTTDSQSAALVPDSFAQNSGRYVDTNNAFAQAIRELNAVNQKKSAAGQTTSASTPLSSSSGQKTTTDNFSNNAFAQAIRELNAVNQEKSAASQTTSASTPLSSASGQKTPTGNFANDAFAQAIMAAKAKANQTESTSDSQSTELAPNSGQYADTDNAFVRAIRETNAANQKKSAASQTASSSTPVSSSSASETASSFWNRNVTNRANTEKNIINRINNILSGANPEQMGGLSFSTASPVKLDGYYKLDSGMIFGNGNVTYAPTTAAQAISYIEVEKGEVLLSGSTSAGNDPTYLSFGDSNGAALDSLVGVNGDFYAKSYSNGLKTLAPVASGNPIKVEIHKSVTLLSVYGGSNDDEFVVDGNNNAIYTGSGTNKIDVLGLDNLINASNGQNLITLNENRNTIISGSDKGNTFYAPAASDIMIERFSAKDIIDLGKDLLGTYASNLAAKVKDNSIELYRQGNEKFATLSNTISSQGNIQYTDRNGDVQRISINELLGIGNSSSPQQNTV